MPVPTLTTYSAGIGVFSSDWGNTVCQGGAVVANLRAYPGLSNMCVWLVGTATQSDGGQGMFVWNGSATAADDNGVTTVAVGGVPVGRWLRQSRNSFEPLNAAWFGVLPNSADNTAAMNAAFAAASLASPGTELVIPAGVYQFSSQPVWTFPTGTFAGTLVGAGNNATVLNWAGGQGMLVAMSNSEHSVHVSGITFTTGLAGVGTGLALYNTTAGSPEQISDVTNCTFRGADGGAQTQYWAVGLDSIAVNFLNYEGCMFFGPAAGTSGIGAQMAGISASSIYSIVHNFHSSSFTNIGVGIKQGTYVQGMTISQCNFTNGTLGVYLPSTSAGAAQIAVVGCQFGLTSYAIELAAACAALLAQGNLIYVPTSHSGIYLGAFLTDSTITGNAFAAASATATFGVYSAAATNACLIVGNSFNGFGAGVYLDTGSTNWNVQSNVYFACTSHVVNNGTGNTVGGGSS